MTKEEIELLNKIKNYVFGSKIRTLCNNRLLCLEDGCCSYYEDCSLYKLKQYSDRQWLNTIKKVKNKYANICFEELAYKVLVELAHKQKCSYKK